MPRYIVETNFFVEAESEEQAQRLVERALEQCNDRRLENNTVAWVMLESDFVPACPCSDPADCAGCRS